MKTFTPIAMRCTKEQFEAVRPKLEKAGINDFKIDLFSQKPYLVNNLLGEIKIVSNIYEQCKSNFNRKVYQKWNEKVFLKACGIKTKKTFKITKEQILEINEFCMMYSRESSTKIKEWFPKAFEEKKVEFKTGYYKHKNNKHPEWFCNIDFETGEYYGRNNLEWMKGNVGMIDYAKNNCEPMTTQEVQQALEKEAVRRGFKEGVWLNYPWFKKHGLEKEPYDPKFNMDSYLDDGDFYYKGVKLMKDGIWAEILETITKDEAEKLLNKKIV